jgi:YidC/Oxa1 family membrane protein insertase
MIELFVSFFDIALYQPLFNGLILLYKYIPGQDFGIAVIVLTILIKVILYPLGAKGIKMQKQMSEIQPKIKEIERKFKNNKEEQMKAIMEFYKKEKVNPLSGCLPLLIQLPILIALYRVFWKGFEPEQMSHLYSFVSAPEVFNPFFLGIINLAEPCIYLALIAGVFQFFQTKMLMPAMSKNQQKKIDPKDPMAGFSNMMQKQMLYFFPIFTVMILWTFPSAIGLYWITFTLFAIAQQKLVLKPEKVSDK